MLEGTIHTAGGRVGHATIDGVPGPVVAELRRRALLARLAAMSLTGFGRRIPIDRDSETAATAVARAWLELVDAGRPSVSRAAAAPALQATIGPEEWEAALRSARAPLGPCRSRKLLHRFTVEAFPGVPPGPYTVSRFESTFDGQTPAIETVTTGLCDDGRWRVAAYFIRQERAPESGA